MKEIDLRTWERKEHYNFFHRMDYPIYNICFNLDVGNLKKYTKKENLSFNLSLIYLSTIVANEIDNFKYRIKDGKVILHERLYPSFTDMVKDSDLFKMVTVDLSDNMHSFVSNAKIISANQTKYFPLDKLFGRDDFIFFSAVPWISFTSIDHIIDLKKDDAIPRITFGKYFANGDQLLMPYNIQVNHVFVDAYHLGKFKELLDNKLMTLS